MSHTYSDASGKFPEYPTEDEGGSAAIFKEKDPAEVEAELRAKVCSTNNLHRHFGVTSLFVLT